MCHFSFKIKFSVAIPIFWMNASVLNERVSHFPIKYVTCAVQLFIYIYIFFFSSLFQILRCKVVDFYLYLMRYYFELASQCLQTSVISREGRSNQADHRLSLRLWNKIHLDLKQTQGTQPVISITAL